MKSSTGRTEINLVDSYKYDIAAYRLAELLGLEDILPVPVERKWGGKLGRTQLVVASENMDEVQRHFGGESDRGYLRLLAKVGTVVVTDNPKL